jgi:hypothetical protein
MARILSLDIETRPALVYTFQAYDVNIGPDQVVDAGGILCWSAKWVGEKGVYFASEWTHSKVEMLDALGELLARADAVISYNGNRFDLPKIQGEFALAGLKPPAPVTSIDVLKAVKKLGFMINKLAFIGPLLNVGNKIKHEGFLLWRSVLEGDPRAQKRMELYNKQDVLLLEKLYLRIKPFIQDHPHLGDERGACGSCGSDHLQQRGWRRTKFFKTQRFQCQSCGSWSTGQRVKVDAEL